MSMAAAAGGQNTVDFEKQIKPILEKHCFECHSDEGDQYPIDDKEEAMNYIVAEEPVDSDMYLVMISDDENEVMPPADYEHQLNDDQKELVKTWITEGADWPDGLTFVKWTPPADEAGAGVAADAGDEVPAPAAGPDIDPRIFKAVGSLHPAVLHLPMGLLLGAGLFAFLSLRGNFVMSDCAYYCLWLGVFGAILASVSGWYFSDMQGKGTVTDWAGLLDMKQPVSWHRASGLICSVFGLLLALFAMSARAKDPDEGVTWKLGAILLAAGIGYVGMTGGKMVYGAKHYKAIDSLVEEYITGPVEDEDAPKAEPNAESADEDSAAEQNPAAEEDAI
jgi:uncharacterized membrane protein